MDSVYPMGVGMMRSARVFLNKFVDGPTAEVVSSSCHVKRTLESRVRWV